MSLLYLNCAGLLAILLASVSYCGSKLWPSRSALFRSTSNAAVFASIAILAMLFFDWASHNPLELKALARKTTRPVKYLMDYLSNTFY